MLVKRQPSPLIIYPSSDGKPMADNTLQLDWIVKLVGNLKNLVHDRADAFAAGNQFWYPVEENTEIVQAPDAYVVFGRPKGYRDSWKQWEEEDMPLTVVFEVISPGNDYKEMTNKVFWYEEYGVEECYIFDPESTYLVAYTRFNDWLRPRRVAKEFTSPRLGIRFDLTGDEMRVFYPDGRPFLTVEQLDVERLRQQRRADNAEQRAARLAFLSRKARQQLASSEELAELERLENELSGP